MNRDLKEQNVDQVVKAGKSVLGGKNTYRTVFAIINSHKLGSLNNMNLFIILWIRSLTWVLMG